MDQAGIPTPQSTQKISLAVVPCEHLRETLALWDGTSELLKRAQGLSAQNVFRRYLMRNRPGAAGPIRGVLSCVFSRYNAIVMLERPYLDLDFWDNHSAFYSGSFTRYPVECERLHFFQGPEQVAQTACDRLLAGATEQEIQGKLGLTYVGYCVLRPTPAFVIGRTAIRFDTREGEETQGSRQVDRRGGKREAVSEDLVPLCGEPSERPVPTRYGRVHSARSQPRTLQHGGTLGGDKGDVEPVWHKQVSVRDDHATGYTWVESRSKRQRRVRPLGHRQWTLRGRNAECSGRNRGTLHAFHAASQGGWCEHVRSVCHEVYSFVESGIPVLLCVQNPATQEGHVITAVGHALPACVNLKDSCHPAFRVFTTKTTNRNSPSTT